MHRIAALSCAALLGACASSETKMDTTAAVATPQGAASISLASVAGKWTVKSMPMASDSVDVTYELDATADTSGWVEKLPDRPPERLRVAAVAGDSIVLTAGPFESVLRKGVQVRIQSVARLKDGKLVGTTVAHYSVKTADSVLMQRFEGTRAP